MLGWPDAVADAPAGNVGPILMLADPFTFPADGLLTQLNEEPGAPVVVGGLASGGRRPGVHRLFAGADVLDRGRRRGGAPRGATCAPWCRRAACRSAPRWSSPRRGLHRHDARGQAGAREAGGGHRGASSPTERALAVEGLLTGLVIDENRPDYSRGDFLMRAIHGGDRETGSLVVGEHVRVGQTMRFHVRDAGSADEDLRAALRDARAELGGAAPGGGARSSAATAAARACSPHPTTTPRPSRRSSAASRPPGLFCNGEIGPVGGRSFLARIHGDDGAVRRRRRDGSET